MIKTLFLSLAIFAIACGQPNKNPTSSADSAVASNDSIRSEVFQVKDSLGNLVNEWGYDIFMHDKLYVHQPSIPAVAGNHGFSSEEEAKKVAGFVVSKIRNHVMPPTVSVEDLDSLNVGPYIGY